MELRDLEIGKIYEVKRESSTHISILLILSKDNNIVTFLQKEIGFGYIDLETHHFDDLKDIFEDFTIKEAESQDHKPFINSAYLIKDNFYIISSYLENGEKHDLLVKVVDWPQNNEIKVEFYSFWERQIETMTINFEQNDLLLANDHPMIKVFWSESSNESATALMTLGL